MKALCVVLVLAVLSACHFGSDDSSVPSVVSESGSGMGPDGTHWPSSTPSYATPATMRVSSLGQLNEALVSAGSGDVIEVAPHTWSQPLTVSSGNASWARNVLVRPPLGQRQSVKVAAELVLDAPHVTLAGFELASAWRARSGATRAAFARMVVSGRAAGFIDDTTDFGLYEIVAPDYGVGGDRLQVRGVSGRRNVRTTIAGSWLKGKFRKIGANDHSDTVQTFGTGGGAIVDLTIEDSVLWTSADKAVQNANTTGLTVRRSYLGECSTNPERPPSGQECPGYHAILDEGTGTAMYDVAVSGSIANTQAYSALVATSAAALTVPAIHSEDNNITSDYSSPPPPLADLDTIWD